VVGLREMTPVPWREDMSDPVIPPRGRRFPRYYVPAVGGPHDGNSVRVYDPMPLEIVIDRCTYVLDETGTADRPGPLYVYVDGS
jgi:hypothetical protein